MEKLMPEPGSAPPPYSCHEYTMGSSVPPSAPYPLTPNSDQDSYTMPVPPPYYFNTMPVGTLEDRIPMPLQSTCNPTHPSAIHNPVVVAIAPTSQETTKCGTPRDFAMRISFMVIVIVILIIFGITVNYLIEEVF